MPRPRSPLSRFSLRERLRPWGAAALVTGMAVASISQEGCLTPPPIRPPRNARRLAVEMEVTGYDNGRVSCGWRRNWYGRPVYAYGPLEGQPKMVGITASGLRASHGTLAADTRHYPFGTVMFVPGYGYGVVEDRGGAIQGPHRLDLWFRSRSQALQWGRRRVKVQVWIPHHATPGSP